MASYFKSKNNVLREVVILKLEQLFKISSLIYEIAGDAINVFSMMVNKLTEQRTI